MPLPYLRHGVFCLPSRGSPDNPIMRELVDDYCAAAGSLATHLDRWSTKHNLADKDKEIYVGDVCGADGYVWQIKYYMGEIIDGIICTSTGGPKSSRGVYMHKLQLGGITGIRVYDQHGEDGICHVQFMLHNTGPDHWHPRLQVVGHNLPQQHGKEVFNWGINLMHEIVTVANGL